jgi:hypothetical protein
VLPQHQTTKVTLPKLSDGSVGFTVKADPKTMELFSGIFRELEADPMAGTALPTLAPPQQPVLKTPLVPTLSCAFVRGKKRGKK